MPPEFPAGSRITKCRSIPICGPCGSDEALEQCELGYISSAGCWPLDPAVIEDRKNRCESRASTAIISGAISDEGATSVVNPRNTGGLDAIRFCRRISADTTKATPSVSLGAALAGRIPRAQIRVEPAEEYARRMSTGSPPPDEGFPGLNLLWR